MFEVLEVNVSLLVGKRLSLLREIKGGKGTVLEGIAIEFLEKGGETLVEWLGRVMNIWMMGFMYCASMELREEEWMC